MVGRSKDSRGRDDSSKDNSPKDNGPKESFGSDGRGSGPRGREDIGRGPGRPGRKSQRSRGSGPALSEDRLGRIEGLLETMVSNVGLLLDGQLGVRESQEILRASLDRADQRLATLEIRVMALSRKSEENSTDQDGGRGEFESTLQGVVSLEERLRAVRGLGTKVECELESLKLKQDDTDRRLTALESAMG